MTNEEYFDVVDEEDRVIDVRSRRDCLKYGLLHRAITIFVRNSQGEIYLQKRNREASTYPRYWTASCTGHVRSRESYLEAAVRELQEELSLDCTPKQVIKFMSPKWNFGELTEWEYISLFEAFHDGPIDPNPDEIEEGKWVTIHELKATVLSSSESLTPDAVLSFEKYLEFTGRAV